MDPKILQTPSASSPHALEVATPKTSSNRRNYGAIAYDYAEQVTSGSIPACKQVIHACRRHLDDLTRSSTGDFEFVFDEESAAYACQFFECFPHVKGKWAKKKEKLRLGDWQVFIACSLFGWVERNERTRYRFREAYLCIPRKNGKSFFAAVIALLKFAADNEYGAEVYFGATSEAQAKRLGFKVARGMAQNSAEFCRAFGVKVNANNLVKEADGSLLKAIIANPGDGDSPSCAVMDEYHEHRTAVQYDTMKTGMGARENPLALVITTAGSNRGGPCFLLQRDIERILDGSVQNERLFGIVYTIDPEDSWTSEDALRKANPNFGVSIEPQFLLDELAMAMQSVRKQNTFKTKHLNIWVNAAVAWMDMEKWKALADPELSLDDFAGEECVIGVDLASEIDIASKVRVFRRDPVEGEPHYYVFATHYLNSLAIEEGRGEHYAGWAAEEWLTATPGNVTDYPRIARELVEDATRFIVREIPHDPYHAAALVQFVQQDETWDQSIEFVKFNQNVANFSPAMKLLEKVVLDGRLHHNGDPVLEWMISNIVCKTISKDNIVPDKEQPDRKIDGGVALMMALSRADTLPSGSGISIDSIEPQQEQTEGQEHTEE